MQAQDGKWSIRVRGPLNRLVRQPLGPMTLAVLPAGISPRSSAVPAGSSGSFAHETSRIQGTRKMIEQTLQHSLHRES